MNVSHVPPAQVPLVWAAIESQARRGLRHGAGDGLTPEHIKQNCLRGDMTLWVVHEGEDIIAGVVLEVVRHPAKTTLLVVLAVGREFASWVETINGLLVEFAELIGADTIEAVARHGMAAWLSEAGWRKKATIMSLPKFITEQRSTELSNGRR